MTDCGVERDLEHRVRVVHVTDDRRAELKHIARESTQEHARIDV